MLVTSNATLHKLKNIVFVERANYLPITFIDQPHSELFYSSLTSGLGAGTGQP